MRMLIESTEDDVPEDIRKLCQAIREEHGRLAATEPRLLFARALSGELGAKSEERHLRVPPDKTVTELLEQGDTTQEPVLERWLIQAHAYGEEAAGKISVFGRLFSGQAQRVKAGVVHDARRFSVVPTEKSRDVEVGVAVRLSVATTRFSGKFELTLPNLAADAQLNGIEARVGITVLGYSGPLGDILPAPRNLDVETCAEYMEAFRKIQAVIFGPVGWRHVVPTALSYEG